MGQQKRLAQFGIVIVLTVIFQLVLIAADLSQTPVRTAEEFVRNYYYMDPAMDGQLCEALSANGEGVSDYLYSVNEDAAQRGFSIKFVRRLFTELHVKTISRDDTSAKVHVSGETPHGHQPRIHGHRKIISSWRVLSGGSDPGFNQGQRSMARVRRCTGRGS